MGMHSTKVSIHKYAQYKYQHTHVFTVQRSACTSMHSLKVSMHVLLFCPDLIQILITVFFAFREIQGNRYLQMKCECLLPKTSWQWEVCFNFQVWLWTWTITSTPWMFRWQSYMVTIEWYSCQLIIIKCS